MEARPRRASQGGLGGHFLLLCRVEAAFAQARWWDGKTLNAPLLAFLGSKRFARVVPLAEEERGPAGAEGGDDGPGPGARAEEE